MTTHALQDMRCPQCGKIGQLKIRGDKYSSITHYQKSHQDGQTKYHGKYTSECYLGKWPL